MKTAAMGFAFAAALCGCSSEDNYEFMSAMQRGIVGMSESYAQPAPMPNFGMNYAQPSSSCYVAPAGAGSYNVFCH